MFKHRGVNHACTAISWDIGKVIKKKINNFADHLQISINVSWISNKSPT